MTSFPKQQSPLQEFKMSKGGGGGRGHFEVCTIYNFVVKTQPF